MRFLFCAQLLCVKERRVSRCLNTTPQLLNNDGSHASTQRTSAETLLQNNHVHRKRKPPERSLDTDSLCRNEPLSCTAYFVFRNCQINSPIFSRAPNSIGGSIPIVYAYFSEFLQMDKRGEHLSWLCMFWMCGGLYASFTAWGIIPHYGTQRTILLPQTSIVLACVTVINSPLHPLIRIAHCVTISKHDIFKTLWNIHFDFLWTLHHLLQLYWKMYCYLLMKMQEFTCYDERPFI